MGLSFEMDSSLAHCEPIVPSTYYYVYVKIYYTVKQCYPPFVNYYPRVRNKFLIHTVIT